MRGVWDTVFPVLFRIPVPSWDASPLGGLSPIPVYSYGVALAVSVVLAWAWLRHWARREGAAASKVEVAFVAAAFGGMVGARLLYVAVNPDEIRSIRDVLAFSRGGLALYGAWWGGWLGAWWQLRGGRPTVWRFGDAAAGAVAVGLAITRVGAYLYGSDFGTVLPETAPTWLARLGTFPRWSGSVVPPGGAGSPAWLEHVRSHGLSPTSPVSLPVHPTQLYEMLLGLLLAGMAWRLRPRFAGQRVLTLAFVDSAARFVLELMRDDPDRGFVMLPVSPRVGLTLGTATLAAAWILGASRSLPPVWRRSSWVVAAMVPVAFLAALGDLPATETTWIASSAQLLALVTAVAVATVYRRRAMLSDVAAETEPSFEASSGDATEPPIEAPLADPFAAENTAEPAPKKKRKKRG